MMEQEPVPSKVQRSHPSNVVSNCTGERDSSSAGCCSIQGLTGTPARIALVDMKGKFIWGCAYRALGARRGSSCCKTACCQGRGSASSVLAGVRLISGKLQLPTCRTWEILTSLPWLEGTAASSVMLCCQQLRLLMVREHAPCRPQCRQLTGGRERSKFQRAAASVVLA